MWDMTNYTSVISINENTSFKVGGSTRGGHSNLKGHKCIDCVNGDLSISSNAVL